VRKVMAGIARANGRPQRQAKPLTETALAAVKATAKLPRKHQGRARRGESARDAERRGRVDVALLSVLRDGLLRRSEAAELRWGDLELQEDGSARLHVRRSKTDPEAEGVVLYIGQEATQALQAIMPEDTAVVDPARRVFELSASQIGRRIDAAAKAAGLGEGFTGHSGRVGMAQDLAASGVELPELMSAGRWKSSRMPARYTERQTAGRGAVARYYQGRRG
jgi:integrase